MSDDRSTFFAVDTFPLPENSAAPTDEALRDRASKTVRLIYGNNVGLIEPLETLRSPWTVGIRSNTKVTSKGEAVYYQHDERTAFGFIFGYLNDREASMLPVVDGARNLFRVDPVKMPKMVPS